MSTPAPTPVTAPTRHRPADVDRYMELMAALRRRIESAFPADLRQELEGVTAHQCEALVWLVLQDGAPMHELARHQAVSVSTCTALVDRLQRQGLVERAGDPADRRVVRVVPTERGATLVRGFRTHKRRIAARFLGALDEAELRSLLTAVERMVSVDLGVEETA